ncbi:MULTISPECIES: phage tail spike protein [Bacteria]|uniref:Phage tail spike protein n=1 Tax=Sphingobacterium tenebrionis TaxID=3111775 RepID=A0ABU8I9V2_9SPHI|nr:phage tail protein [Bacillus cereus]MBL3774314.1 phage tail protein [Bacillus cereus]MBL3780068.1 phage tail protein [Bacillus cereus]MBL3791139.1 phage tail protein [Bacillus cereus]
MRKPSGQLHVVDHSTEQIVAVLQPNDYRDDLRHWEIKNNIDRLEFKVFTSLPAAATLMQQNLVLRETRDGRIIPYTIDEAIQTTDNRTIHVYASAVWVEIAQANYIRPQKIQSKTVNEFMDMALAGTKWKRGFTEYSGFHTMTIDTFIDPLKFLKDIASLFHLEIQYRVEVLGSQIVGWYVDMIQRRGKDEGKEITLGKDLIGIKRIENTRNICTALVGFVKGEGDSVITIESINKGLPYIVDTQAFQLWNKKGFHRFGFYTPETENQNMTPQRLKTLMEMEIKKRRNAAVTYEAEAQSINRVFGLDHESIFEGDTLRFKDKGFTPPLYLEARAIAGDESFKNPLMDKYEFGDYRELTDIGAELRRIYNRILGLFGDKQEILDQLDQLVKDATKTAEDAQKESEAAKDLAKRVEENIKNNSVEIIEGITPPTDNLKPNKTLWLDISKGKPGILKKWTGTEWDPIVPDVESAKKDLLEKVEEAKKEATGQYNKVTETIQGVSRTVSSVQNEQGDIKKTISLMEQTATGFKQSIESLVTKDNNISEKLNTLESTAEGTKQTISDVSSKQSGFEQRITTVEKTATGLSSSVSDLNNIVDAQGKKLTEANTRIEQQAKAIEAKVNIKQVEDYVAVFEIPTLKEVVGKNKEDLLDELAHKISTEQFNTKMTQIDNRFVINEQGLDLRALKTEVYTTTESDGRYATGAYARDLEGRIQVTEKNILSTVKKGEIISSINQSAERIKISADLIDLVGKVEASWLRAGLLIGMTIKTSNENEYLHMENQVLRFVNQGTAKMIIGFENEYKSKTRNPYIILGEGDGSGRNFGSIYKDGNGVYYRYVDLNGAESNIRMTAQGHMGITAQDSLWVNSKRTNFNSVIEVPAIRFNSLGTTPGSQQGNLWMGNGYKGFGLYYYDTYWKFIQGS